MATKNTYQSTRNYYLNKTWRTQNFPSSAAPLPYSKAEVTVKPGKDYSSNASTMLKTPSFIPTNDFNYVSAQARARWLDNVKGSNAQLAVTAIEWRQAMESVTRRATKTALIVKRMVDFNFRARRGRKFDPFLEYLKNKQGPWSEFYLELHFGLIPLSQELQAVTNLIANNDIKAKSFGSAEGHFYKDQSVFTSQYVPVLIHDYRFGVAIAGPVSVSNSNSLLFNQLGLDNFAATAWELVPLSFIIDWFATTAQFFSQFQDLSGLDTSKVSSTRKVVGWTKEWIQYGLTTKRFDGPRADSFYFERSVGAPTVNLAYKPFKGFSPRRGAAAISLLLIQLGRLQAMSPIKK